MNYSFQQTADYLTSLMYNNDIQTATTNATPPITVIEEPISASQTPSQTTEQSKPKLYNNKYY